MRVLPAFCAFAFAATAAHGEASSIAFEARGRPTHALFLRPPEATALVVLAHGAQLDMRSPLLATLAEALAERKVATLRFNFPFADAGRAKPDPAPVLTATVNAAVRLGAERSAGAPVVLAGQSFGGLVVAQAFQEAPPPVAGVALVGYPLHQAGLPSGRNARVLESIGVPLLLVQGSRDPLGELRLVQALAEQLGAELRVVYGADHRFEPEPGAGEARALFEQVADAIAGFTATLPRQPGGTSR